MTDSGKNWTLKPVEAAKMPCMRMPGGVGGPFVSVIEYGFEQIGLHGLHADSGALRGEVERGASGSFGREVRVPGIGGARDAVAVFIVDRPDGGRRFHVVSGWHPAIHCRIR
jgi:hypothetical protein